MRVYLAMTPAELTTSWEQGVVTASARAHAVTPALGEWYGEADQEELEYAAMTEAARDSLRLLAANGDPQPRRVVAAAEVPEQQVDPARPDGAEDRTRVRVTQPVPVPNVAAVHVDSAEADDAVRAAVEALPAAEDGDPDATSRVAEAFAHELLWYARQEVDRGLDWGSG